MINDEQTERVACKPLFLSKSTYVDHTSRFRDELCFSDHTTKHTVIMEMHPKYAFVSKPDKLLPWMGVNVNKNGDLSFSSKTLADVTKMRHRQIGIPH